MFGEIDLFLVAVFTAVLVAGGLVTIVASWLLARRVRRLRAELEADLERATADAVKQIGDEVEARVRRGVRDGLRDGVASLPSRAVLEDTTRAAAKTVAQTGADLIGSGLGALLGGRRDRPER